MMKSNFYKFLLAIIIAHIQANPRSYEKSEDCPGNLKWNPVGKTIIGVKDAQVYSNLSFPEGLFIEPKTQILYLTDVVNNWVQKYYPNGKLVIAAGQASGESGNTPDKLSGPRDVFADEYENVYIADWSNQRVQMWQNGAASGITVAGNGQRGSDLGEFSYPSRVLVDSKKNVIVADLQNQRIMQWAPKNDDNNPVGQIIAGGNGMGMNPNQLYNPMGIYLDEKNQMLYISNEDSHTITQWPLEPYAQPNVYAGIPGRPGTSAAQLFEPQGITLDPYGNLYVTDSNNNRIQMFCPGSVFGITIAGTGETGSRNDQLHFPREVAFDAELNLYVSDTYNMRIQKFERIH